MSPWPAIDPEEGREKSGDAKKDTRTGGGDKIHMEREKEKGGGEKYKRTKGPVV